MKSDNETEEWEQAADLLDKLSFEDYVKIIKKIREKYNGKQTLARLQLALDYYFAEDELRDKSRSKNDF